MTELLLELLSEDIPARMQARAAEDLKRLVTEKLKDARLKFKKAEAYVTPRRLTLVVDGLPEMQAGFEEEKRGPRYDVSDETLHGFVRSTVGSSHNPETLRNLEVDGPPLVFTVTSGTGRAVTVEVTAKSTAKGDFFFVKNLGRSQSTVEVLAEFLPGIIWNFPWPKSMRWGGDERSNLVWIRPLHGILCVFNGKRVEFDLTRGIGKAEIGEDFVVGGDPAHDIKSRNLTVGHRFLAPAEITVKNFADYKAKLKKAHVVLDPAERRKAIWKEAQRLAKAEGLTVKADEGLLAEVAGLVEWPKVFMGRIDAAFMDLPAEVLTTVMRHHQKYFSLVKKDGSLAPRFIVVADTEPDDGGKAITAGNERVLRARLADAKFFWDQDRKRTLISRIDDLDGVVFHAKLGSLGDKVRRIEVLAANIAELLSFDADATREAARLCKADLTTDMVGEFPELQGVMGRYYALAEGRGETVAAAIAEHYSPQGPNDDCPSAPASVAVALADKIDSLVGFWSIDEKPTGSKDPFALRRAALGVIRLIVENKLRVSLSELFHKAYELYPLEIRASESVTSPHIDIGAISINLLLFFIDRLKVHLREKGVRHDLISAVVGTHRLDVGLEDNLVRLLDKVDAVKEFLGGEDGINLLTAYKRTANILRIEGEKDGVAYKGADVDDELLREGDEQALAARLGEVSALADAALGHEDFAAAMSALARLRKPVDGFFDQVTVNCDDADLRRNRLRLLGAIRNTMDRVADFSKIEGGER